MCLGSIQPFNQILPLYLLPRAVDSFGEEGICANCMLKIVAASSNLPKKHLLHMLLEKGCGYR